MPFSVSNEGYPVEKDKEKEPKKRKEKKLTETTKNEPEKDCKRIIAHDSWACVAGSQRVVLRQLGRAGAPCRTSELECV